MSTDLDRKHNKSPSFYSHGYSLPRSPSLCVSLAIPSSQPLFHLWFSLHFAVDRLLVESICMACCVFMCHWTLNVWMCAYVCFGLLISCVLVLEWAQCWPPLEWPFLNFFGAPLFYLLPTSFSQHRETSCAEHSLVAVWFSICYIRSLYNTRESKQQW